MVTLLLALIACILLFGPLGLGVFAGIMICILPLYVIFHVLKIVVGHKRKHPQKDRADTKEKRSKAAVLYKGGKWVGNQKSRKF